MQGVAESSSEKILLLVDELISEGHSPTHFARQMVRFLRNAVVARVAGPEQRAQLWPQVTADHKNYAGYQTKTEREIPLVLLEPVS